MKRQILYLRQELNTIKILKKRMRQQPELLQRKDLKTRNRNNS